MVPIWAIKIGAEENVAAAIKPALRPAIRHPSAATEKQLAKFKYQIVVA